MKVALDDFKAALALFEAEFVNTFKTSMQKFIAGTVIAASGAQIDSVLANFTKDGIVDVDAIRDLINAGMKSCGGQIDIPINFGVLSSLGATPIEITITLNDIEKFFGQTLPAVSKPVKSSASSK